MQWKKHMRECLVGRALRRSRQQHTLASYTEAPCGAQGGWHGAGATPAGHTVAGTGRPGVPAGVARRVSTSVSVSRNIDRCSLVSHTAAHSLAAM